MKKSFCVLIFLLTLGIQVSYSQDEIICGTISTDSIYNYHSNGVESLAVVLVDFPEGRKQPGNNLPTNDADTAYFGADSLAIDAVGGMGYEINNGVLRKRIRKYTFDNYWDWVFDSTYTGNGHPDSASHGVVSYGSLKDYYNEVSYNKLSIIPAKTWHGSTSKYTRGIINAYDTANGKKYVRWIMMPNPKASYSSQNGPLEEVIPVLIHQRDTGAIDFDVETFLSNGGKILVIVAGGGNGGVADMPSDTRNYNGLILSVREKNFRNYQSKSTLDGLWVLVHEYGHTLDFDHLASSSYDPMNPTLTSLWGNHIYSPPHFNPLYKISRGWISASDVISIKNDTSITLPPINTTPKVATITLYGDAGRDYYWNHSEYFIAEYRKREGFNRFSGGAGVSSFGGGVLLWHISNYHPFVNTYETGTTVTSKIGLKINGYVDFVRDLGDSLDFYNTYHDSIGLTTSPNTNSADNLATGIRLSGFSLSNNQISISAQYSLGAVPQWSQVIHSNSPTINTNLSGNIYYDITIGPLSTHFQIANGTKIYVAPGKSFHVDRITANASNQDSIIFTGVGFGNNVAQWEGIQLQSTLEPGPSSLQKCLIKNAERGIRVLRSDYYDTLKNISFQNNVCDISLQNISGNENKLPYMSGNTFDSMYVSGQWTLATNQQLYIPGSSKVVIESGSKLKLASGANIVSFGKLFAIGTPSSKIIFTPLSGSGPGAWGNIVFDGNGADYSKLEFCKFDGGGEIQCINGADVFIDSSIFRRMNRGIYFSNSAPWILNNSLDSITLNPVEGNSNYEAVSVYDNIIRRSHTSKGYYGLYLVSTNGNIIRNKIDGFSKGMYFKSEANPSFNRGDGYTPNPDNKVINNTTGIHVRESYPILGDNDAVEGNNAIYNNTTYNLYAEMGSEVYAENNFFGCGDPGISFDQDSYVSSEATLSVDPFGEEECQNNLVELAEAREMISIPAAISLNMKNEYRQGLRLKKEGKQALAVNHFSSMYLSGKIPNAALAQLTSLYSDSIDYGIYGFLESQRTVISKHQKQVLLALAKLSNRRGDVVRSKELYDEIIAKYPKSSAAEEARYQKFYIALHQERNKESAQILLKELLDWYPSEETAAAKYLLETAIFDISEKEKSQSIRRVIPAKAVTSVTSNDNTLQFELSGNYPNPFNPMTTIHYTIPESGMVTMTVYDVVGRTVTTLVNEYQAEGKHSIPFDAQKYASGLYFYKLVHGKNIAIRKMMVLK